MHGKVYMKMRKKYWIYLILIILLVQPIYGDVCGCCEDFCIDTTPDLCQPAELYHSGASCNDVENCNLGCCIDEEGYCFTSYPKGNCDRLNNTFEARDCTEVYQCRTVLDQFSIRGYTGLDQFYDPIMFILIQI